MADPTAAGGLVVIRIIVHPAQPQQRHRPADQIARQIDTARGFSTPQGSVWNRGPANFNVALGANFDQRRGHAVVYVDYRDTPALTKDQRDYTTCSVQNLGATGPACGGSATWQGGRFIVSCKPGTTGAAGGDFVIDPDTGAFRARRPTDVFNCAPFNFMQRPDTLWRGGGFMNCQWNRHADGCEHPDRLGGHLGADAVARDDRDTVRHVRMLSFVASCQLSVVSCQ